LSNLIDLSATARGSKTRPAVVVQADFLNGLIDDTIFTDLRLFMQPQGMVLYAGVEMDDHLPAHRRIETMPERPGVLLTGATGLLGQYLLYDLLSMAHPVAVLVRDSRQEQAAERIAQIVAFWNERLRRKLPTPTVLNGDLGHATLGLTAVDRRWLGRHCRIVIHSAANLSFRETSEGEPWRTNALGTKSLLALCQDVGLSEWHQVSTAFVCGRRAGIITEEDHDNSQGFHNPYEESKWQAEQLVRRTPGVRATIYRPAVIVGDSRTGYTSSFNGLYRFLELAVRLASVNSTTGEVRLPLRLPLSGDEVWNLVSVDWVSRAIVELLARPQWHGRTFHLVARSPVSNRFVRDIAAEVLNLPGVEFAGTKTGVENSSPSRLEQLFFDGIREYSPYLGGNPVFASVNTAAALPDLPPPVDRPMLERLIRFAVASRWGRSPPQPTDVGPGLPARSFCAEYIERIFPKQARQSRLAREAGLDLTVCIDLRGLGGGQWSCKWKQGELVYARRGVENGAAVTYHSDTTTFHAVVSGLQTPQEVFFEQRIAITGDLECALKLAVLFGQFLAEHPIAQPDRTEVMDATPFRI
jgi:thioester reductase-like protein